MTCKPQCSVTVEETNLRQRGNKQQRQGSKPPTAHAQHNNNERTDEPETRPKAQDERGRRREAAREPKDDGRAEGGGGKERKGRGEKRRAGEAKARGRGEEGEAKARKKGGDAAKEARGRAGKEDNRQPQEHERERQEDKLVPTTTRKSNSLRAKGRDSRVVVWRRGRPVAATPELAQTDVQPERTPHPTLAVTSPGREDLKTPRPEAQA